MPGRIPRLSVGFIRSRSRFGLTPGSKAFANVTKAIRTLAETPALPTFADFETAFAPGRAWVRRVSGHNLWLLYRFDAAYLDVLALRDAPPVPAEPEPT